MTSVLDVSIDTSGLACPLPLLRTKKALAQLKPGQRLLVKITDEGSAKDLCVLCQQTGDRLLSLKRDGQGVYFGLIVKSKTNLKQI